MRWITGGAATAIGTTSATTATPASQMLTPRLLMLILSPVAGSVGEPLIGRFYHVRDN
jgi:hypothetical protein